MERHIDEARRGHDDLAQVLTAVSLGKVVTLLPASVTARYPRPGVVYRPVPEAPPVVLALAWPERSRSTATAALVRVAAEVAEAARNGA